MLKEESVQKFKSHAGADWRNSKFSYVISSMQGSIYEMKELVKSMLNTNDRLACICSCLPNAGLLYAQERRVNFNHQKNYMHQSIRKMVEAES